MKKSIRKLLIYLATLFVLSSFTAIYLVQMTGVTGNSMMPELSAGQSVLVNKTVYRIHEPERFDVVVFRYLYKDNQYYVKRIIGLPGETVQIIDGSVYINGEKLKEPYASEPIRDAGRAANPIELGKDEYFVLGDNRNFSSDSRETDVGNVNRVQILGKAFIKLWPFARIH